MRKIIRVLSMMILCSLSAALAASCARSVPKSETMQGEVKSIATYYTHSMVVMADGTLWAWGQNYAGQLGDGTTEDRFSPVKIMDDVTMVSTSEFSMAMKNDGTLWAWGKNDRGQLGDGTTENRLNPVKIMDDVKSVSVSHHAFHTAVIKTDGSLWVWGAHLEGSMGNGTTFNDYYPQVPTKMMENVVSASAGGNVVMAILEDGTLWAWGPDSEGSLGNGTNTGSIMPVHIMDNVSYIKANAEFTSAITTDGALWTWGFNQYGMLGNGTRGGEHYSPEKIMDDVIYTDGTKAITADGTLWAWHFSAILDADGNSELKHLSESPTAVMDNVAQVSGSSYFALILMEDGTLWGWGQNEYGQLGVPSATYFAEPTIIYAPS